MNDVRAPMVKEPAIVILAPKITPMITDSDDAAFSPPINSPLTFCGSKEIELQRERERERTQGKSPLVEVRA